MKIKLDFITNSSSVSFVVIGHSINMKEIHQPILQKMADDEGIEFKDLMDDRDWVMDKITKDSDLEYSFGSEYDDQESVMIGVDYYKMKDEETLLEFKRRVRRQILEKTGIESAPGHIAECWRDG